MILNQDKVREILASEDFGRLVKIRMSVSITLTAVMLVVYFGFILLVAFNKEFLSLTFSGSLTIGLPIGIGIIIFAWLITGIYTWWANNAYDKKVCELRDRVLSHL